MNDEELKKVIKDIKNRLFEIINLKANECYVLVKYYWKVSQQAEKLILATLGEEGYHFPIDVVALANKLGIFVVEENLNEFANKRSMNRKIGQIEIFYDPFFHEKSITIYIDKMAAISSKRYAVAHELVHYILNYDTNDYYEDYCIMPMCPIDVEEIVADIFANFLLIPIRLFFDEFKKYVITQIEREKTPVTTEKWMDYLAERSLLSQYYVAFGYQQLRYVAYWIYQAHNSNECGDIMSDNEREEVINATKDYFDNSMDDLLFR